MGAENCPLLIKDTSDLEDFKRIENNTKELKNIKELYNLFNNYSLDQGELACLKAIVLFRPGGLYIN